MSSKLFALAALLVVTMPLAAHADWDSATEPNPHEVDMHAWQNVNYISDRDYIRELELHGYTKKEVTKIAHQRFQRISNPEFTREEIKRMRVYAHNHLEGVDAHKLLQRAQRMEDELNKADHSTGEAGHSAKSIR